MTNQLQPQDEKTVFTKELIFKILSVAIKLAVIVGVIIGVYATSATPGTPITSGNYMASRKYLFFTIQSNLTIAATLGAFLVLDIINFVKEKQGKAKIEIPNCLMIIKQLFTVAIMLTFLVFWLILAPGMVAAGSGAYLVTASNIFCHTLVPLLALADWLLFYNKCNPKKWEFIYGISMPLYYVAFTYICDACGVIFTGEDTVPYFFFNYKIYSWFSIGDGKFGVFYWIVILVLLVLGLSWVISFLKKTVVKKYGN